MRFSASMLNAWGGCSLKAKFNYIDRLPTKLGSSAHFGSCVHLGCELLNKGRPLDEAVDAYLEAYSSTIPDYWNRRTNFEQLRVKGIGMIEEYHATLEWKKDHSFLGVEHSFMVNMGEHTVSGIVDYIDVSPDGVLTIGDLKTGRKPNRDNLHLLLQFTIYDYASRQKEFWTGWPENLEKFPPIPGGAELYERFQDVDRRLIWHDLKEQEEIDVGPRGMKDYARAYRCMEQIDRAIQKEVFVPSVSADTCGFCDFKDICPVYWDASDA